MLLYLVRHGKAENTGGDDRFRHLTDRGRADVQQMADHLSRVGMHVEMVQHSTLVRAQETAAILHEAVGGQLEEVSGLGPLDDVAVMARQLDRTTHGSLMLVGHTPFMGRMAAHLLSSDTDADLIHFSGDTDADLIHFRTASVANLSGIGRIWRLEWFLEPGVL